MNRQPQSDTIRIVVQPKLKVKIKQKADLIGVNLSEYVRFLILNDLKDMLEFEASDEVKQSVIEAEKQQNRITPTQNDTEDIFNNL